MGSGIAVSGRVDTDQLHGRLRRIGPVADDLAALGRALAGDAQLDLTAARQAVLAGVLHALPAMARISLTFWSGGKRAPVTLAASDDTALAVDELQYRAGHGPCLQALSDLAMIHVPDLGAETRWPSFVPAALAESPVRGVLSCSLAAGGQRHTSLNIYADEPIDPAGPEPEVLAAVAAGSAMALAAIDQRHRADHLDRALVSGRRIGVAIGILMARRQLTEEQAFEAMKAASQRGNRKLRELADDVVATGELPDGRLPWYSA